MVDSYNGNLTINNIKENSFVIREPENFNNNNDSGNINNDNNNSNPEINSTNDDNNNNNQKNVNDYSYIFDEKYENSNGNDYEIVDLISNDRTNNAILNNNSSNKNITVAKRRWKILAKALCIKNELVPSVEALCVTSKKSLVSNTQTLPKQSFIKSTNLLSKIINESSNVDIFTSVRRFTTFGLIKKHPIVAQPAQNVHEVKTSDNWFCYKITVAFDEYAVKVHHINRPLTPDDLMGFNNTGNICVWPSEEALAYLALNKLSEFNNRNVLELGGGMTCLAGLLIAKYASASYVHLTDGNELAVANVQTILDHNEGLRSANVQSSVLKWENINQQMQDEVESFDFILSADCLFFDDARTALVDTIWCFLKPDGCALIMAPHRGKTLNLFVEEAEKTGFICEIVNCYNQLIWDRHLELKKNHIYDENIHYPTLIKLRKK